MSMIEGGYDQAWADHLAVILTYLSQTDFLLCQSSGHIYIQIASSAGLPVMYAI